MKRPQTSKTVNGIHRPILTMITKLSKLIFSLLCYADTKSLSANLGHIISGSRHSFETISELPPTKVINRQSKTDLGSYTVYTLYAWLIHSLDKDKIFILHVHPT